VAKVGGAPENGGEDDSDVDMSAEGDAADVLHGTNGHTNADPPPSALRDPKTTDHP
jgi:hypothetical protein